MSDRAGDAELLAAHGLLTVRITRGRFRRHPAEEAEQLHAILARRRPR